MLTHIHYSPVIQKLVREAPLQLGERLRTALPAPRIKLDRPIDEVILSRVSGRNFGRQPMTAEQLATVLYLGNAVRSVREGEDSVHYQRQAPNSGNLGSVEVFPVILNVSGIEPGIYHFDSIAHDLSLLKQGQFSAWLNQRVFYQVEYSGASAALVLTSAIGRLTAKYGQRAYRLALLDVGHVSQNIYLTSTALSLQVCATAGFIDDELDAALGLDGIDTASMLVVLLGSTGTTPP